MYGKFLTGSQLLDVLKIHLTVPKRRSGNGWDLCRRRTVGERARAGLPKFCSPGGVVISFKSNEHVTHPGSHLRCGDEQRG